ncbi:MAG: hypothetical protein ACXAB2_00935 [Candidatus Hodarchaeales archaeon]
MENNMNKSPIKLDILERAQNIDINYSLKILLILEMGFLVYYSNYISIDHQDSWVLAGLEIPYLLFTASYILFFYLEKSYNKMVIFSILARMIFVLLPNLKYAFFLGRSIDQMIQYNLANVIIKSGSIADLFNYFSLTTKYYVGVPFLHMSLSIYSILLGTPLSQSFKYLPVLWNIIYPLVTYTIAKKTKINEHPYLFKLALFMSSIPISTSITYIITGSLFVTILTYFYLSQLMRAIYSSQINLKNFFLFVFFVIGSTLSHSISTLHFLTLFTSVILLNQIGKYLSKLKLTHQLLFIAFILNITWLTYQAIPIQILTTFLKALGITKAVPITLITLSKVDIISTIKIFILIYGTDIIISGLILLSIIKLYSNKQLKTKYQLIYPFITIFMIIIWILTIMGFVFGITYNYWGRVLRLSYFFYPFIYGIFLYEQTTLKNKKVLQLMVFIIVPIFASIQFYKNPLFIPSASTISSEIAVEEPIIYRGEVNSIYQRHLISFSEERVRGRIATDAVSRNQIFGLTDSEYSRKNLIWYYPPNIQIYPETVERLHDYFFIHLPGVGGSFEEQAIVRTKEIIEAHFYMPRYDIVYSNGVSYLLANRK